LWQTTAAHEVHDLDPVIVVQHRVAPLAAAHDLAIEFDRDSRGRQIKLVD
jgi:hypothetical protein